MILEDGMILYHGSYCVVESPDLDECKPGKDFGRGFYVTTDLAQAKRFVASSCRKAIIRKDIPEDSKKGFVSSYIYHHNKKNAYYEFENVDKDWLRYVAWNRKKDFFCNGIDEWEDYDIIAGKIANDTTNEVLANYLNGAFGKADDPLAIDIAIRLLKPGKLKDQICFRTKNTLKCLEFVDSIEVKINENK